MSRTVFTLFDDNRSIYQSDLPEAGGTDMLAFSGALLNPISVEDVRTVRTLWISVGARDGEVTVTLTYVLEGVQTYTVSPGRPLVTETISRLFDELESIVISPVGRAATVEILVYPGKEEEPPLVPVDALLALNAASGVEVEDGRVTSWRDLRSGSGAPGAFLPVSEDGPFIFPSDGDFNGQPTIIFGVVDMRLVSEDAPSVFDFLGTGPFTIAMVCAYGDEGREQQGVSNSSASNGGFMMGVDGGFRTIHRITDDSGTPNNEGTGVEELAPHPTTPLNKAFTHIIRYDGTTLEVYRQGETIEVENIGVVATAVFEALHLGGDPDGNGLCNMTIADLRIWDRRLTNDEQADYITFGQLQYGVDDTAAAQAPVDALYFIRANRGILQGESNSVIAWGDTRPESTFDPMGPRGGKADPTFLGSDSFFNGHPSVDWETTSAMQYSGDASDFNLMAFDIGPWTMTMVFVPKQDGTNLSLITSFQPGAGTNFSVDVNEALRVIVRNQNLFIANTSEPGAIEVNTPQALFFGGELAVSEEVVVNVVRRGANLTFTDNFSGIPEGPLDPALPLVIGEPDAFQSASFRLVELRLYPRFLSFSERIEFMSYAAERYDIIDVGDST